MASALWDGIARGRLPPAIRGRFALSDFTVACASQWPAGPEKSALRVPEADPALEIEPRLPRFRV